MTEIDIYKRKRRKKALTACSETERKELLNYSLIKSVGNRTGKMALAN